MRKLLVIALVGLAAQLVDGSLGMAYGLTSSTLLLLVGVAPAAASASVHLAEIGTTLAAGTAHWRFGNVDWRVVRRIAVPGALGAFAGATFLSACPPSRPPMDGRDPVHARGVPARPVLPAAAPKPGRRPATRAFPRPARSRRGFVDATGGGGWGPVATPALLVSGRLEPRKVIGSVDTSEFVVASAASLGFLIGLGTEGFLLPIVLALLAGGLIAAPVAAWLVRIVPAQLLGAAVGGVIVLTNARVLMRAGDVDGSLPVIVYLLLAAGWITALTLAVRVLRRTAASGPSPRPSPPTPRPPPHRPPPPPSRSVPGTSAGPDSR